MRKSVSVLVFFLFLLILSNPSLVLGAKQPETPQTSYEGPKAHFSETTWDFGRIPSSSVVSHSYWIKNLGTDTLKIMKVRPG